MSNYQLILSKKDSIKIIKSVSQELRERDNQAAKVVPQLEDFKERYIEVLSNPFELTKSEVESLESAYPKVVPPDVILCSIKESAIDYIRKIMEEDLSRLLIKQLEQNDAEIVEDKQHLDCAMTALNVFSETIEAVIMQPKCKAFVPWKGAELEVIGHHQSSSKESNESWTVVRAENPSELSYVISTSYGICEHFVNYMTKYWFLEQLGRTAIKFESDDEIDLYRCVIETAKDNISQLHENFIRHKNEQVGDRRIKIFN